MIIPFYKYQATGNDFILIDNRSGEVRLNHDQIVRLCDRKFGIGSDGLMLIEKSADNDFHLQFYNPDGSQSLCGNGSRAAVVLASTLGMINGKSSFSAFDGLHEASLQADGTVRLKMNPVERVTEFAEGMVINTGSPHLVKFVDKAEGYPIVDEGRKIRNSETFRKDGINVNFVELQPNNTIFVRTYERGVENETLSCGTGVTAAALAASLKGYSSPVSIKTRGGDLQVAFKSEEAGVFNDIYLIGPAKPVFTGKVTVNS